MSIIVSRNTLEQTASICIQLCERHDTSVNGKDIT